MGFIAQIRVIKVKNRQKMAKKSIGFHCCKKSAEILILITRLEIRNFQTGLVLSDIEFNHQDTNCFWLLMFVFHSY